MKRPTKRRIPAVPTAFEAARLGMKNDEGITIMSVERTTGAVTVELSDGTVRRGRPDSGLGFYTQP